ncbi:sulfurtransferase TusA family protein [Paraclostridium benzoelyticum]|uniref:sulfurtransferase TusA family protein n=1 Tax=Paraclostridium benzoelyticum TaxID=1629550 RepID=UPI0031CCF43D
MESGDIIEVKASDVAFSKDIKAWCETTGNSLLKAEFNKDKKAYVAYIQKEKILLMQKLHVL